MTSLSSKEPTYDLIGTSVAFSEFVRRQTTESHFSHWTIPDKEFLFMLELAIDGYRFTEGYRPGVVLVHWFDIGDFDYGTFFTGVVDLKEGDELIGSFKARQPGETPRQQTFIKSDTPFNVCVFSVMLASFMNDLTGTFPMLCDSFPEELCFEIIISIKSSVFIAPSSLELFITGNLEMLLFPIKFFTVP